MRVPRPAFDPALTAPFELGEGPACLLVHGFTGSPWEMRPLGEALAARGFRAVGLRLPGHGTTPEAMLDVGFGDWRRAVEEALEGLGEESVCVAGLSMGALLALDLAARFPRRVRRLALLAPAFALQDPLARAVRPLRALPLLELRPWVAKHSVDLEDPEAQREAPVVPAFPSARLRDLWSLQEIATAALEQVRAPSLVVMGEKDHVVTAGGIQRAVEGLSRRAPVRFILQPGAAHLLPRDHGRALLESEVAQFFAG